MNLRKALTNTSIVIRTRWNKVVCMKKKLRLTRLDYSSLISPRLILMISICNLASKPVIKPVAAKKANKKLLQKNHSRGRKTKLAVIFKAV